MKTTKISNPIVVEEIRKQMAEATVYNKGLMSTVFLSENGSFSTNMASYSGNLDEIHTIVKNGITVIACAVASTNRPYPDDGGGILININRLEGFSSRIVYQEYISMNKGYKKKIRCIYFKDSNPEFSPWE
ncbi:hypothetical protein SAMN05444349_12413 [Bacteroides faecichinchillae]|uniref:Uncharacterized protein n=1 Tax=Bacteroides faecichinchillae TaxID=871325 RepID=A0A1M5CES9_9BACE|nr:hypothetical protein [Bacteroides faecichinchillae]SHF53248.1 hypothetical protein SAMN05444349_12413 [Bacteroides faecichinchillae]